MSSPISQAFLGLLAVSSFIYAIICQRLNKERKEFSYCVKSNVLIRKKKSKFEKLSITYDGNHIDNLCVSRYTIWNSGNRTLNRSDIVDTKELTISIAETYEILDVELIACSEETNNFSIQKIDKQTAKIFFEYADKKDGLVVQIIHTGTDEDITIDCKIKGGNPMKNKVNKPGQNFILKASKKPILVKCAVTLMGLIFVMPFISVIIFALSIFIPKWQQELFYPTMLATEIPHNAQLISIFMTIMTSLLSIVISMVFIPHIKAFFKMGVPKKLKKY